MSNYKIALYVSTLFLRSIVHFNFPYAAQSYLGLKSRAVSVIAVEPIANQIIGDFSNLVSRIPLPYQYSALSQFDQDPDDDINELEDNLHMLVEDSSSEGDDFQDPNGGDDEVFQSATTLGVQSARKPKLLLRHSDSSNDNEVLET